MSTKYVGVCDFSATGFAWWRHGDGDKIDYCTCMPTDPADFPEGVHIEEGTIRIEELLPKEGLAEKFTFKKDTEDDAAHMTGDSQIQPLLKLLRSKAHYEFEARSKAADLIEKFAVALHDIARQKKSTEWEQEGDTVHGYDSIIDVARNALNGAGS